MKLHLQAFLILLIILGAGVAAYLYFQHRFWPRLIVVVLTSLAYWLWGIIHHWRKGDLNYLIFWEYSLISLIVASLLIFNLYSL